MKNGSVKQFKFKGYPCEVKAFMGHYDGYVDLPKTSPYFGIAYENIPVECHGGLTYDGQHGSFWRIGFDCSHALDLLDPEGLDPEVKASTYRLNDIASSMGGEFRDIEYVVSNLKSIVDQLIDNKN